MALFTNTKEDAKEKAPATKKEVKAVSATKKKPVAKEKKAVKPSKNAGASLTKSPHMILKSPRITEKAAYMTMQHAYVFEVAQDATKRDVIAVVRALYQVTPVKVNIVNKKPRAFVSRFRNRRGIKSGMKKAYVFLKKGEKIDLV